LGRIELNIEEIKAAIRDVPDFPSPGIVFKDIAPLLAEPLLFRSIVDHFAERHRDAGLHVVAGIEARGFVFGAALAYALGVGFVPIRKKGKLPWHTVEASYDLEYGSATIEMHQDAITPGARVLLIDDLLATGGTAAAAARLVRDLGGTVVEIDFLIELAFLEGRKQLSGHILYAPLVY
jgi:adenine phosphoribosyltransferase